MGARMLRKGLVVAVILLFFGVAFAIPINANLSKSSLDPVPDLNCEGDLCWADISPGATITGDFTVENIGEPGSLLNWEIESYPDWGTDWTFNPDSYEGLTPEDGPIIVDVELIAPDDPNVEISGEIRVVNVDDPSDYDIVDIQLAISMDQHSINLENMPLRNKLDKLYV